MPEEIETLMKAQIEAMRNQIDSLRGLVVDTEEQTARLKHLIADEMVDALVTRFQRNEKKIDDMHERLNNVHHEIKDQLMEVKRMKDRHLSDRALQNAIKKITEDAEIKVDSEPLYELKV